MRALLFTLLLTGHAVGQTATEISCPATIAGNEKPSVQHPFERFSIYNGAQGGREYQLAPDNEKRPGRLVIQTWFLKNYRDMNIFIRCEYRGTKVTFAKDIPAPFKTCEFRFEMDAKGNITGKQAAVCR